ncbi:hypothetical protein MASR1M74_11930 [Lentimicrobium sp.]
MKKNFTLSFSVLGLVLLFGTTLFAQSDITGSVLYHHKANKPIPSVELNLMDADGNLVATTTTALNGTFTFTDVPYGTYSIEATTAISSGGINMADAFMMLMHLLNLYPLSPIQQLAADVDGDGSVTWNDYFTVLSGWFVQGYPYPVGSWVFENSVYTHSANKTNWPSMGGSSAGDVNGTFVPSTRDAAAIDVDYTQQPLTPEFTLNVKAGALAEVAAMGIIARYNANEMDITRVSSPLGNIEYTVENGEIRVSWVNTTGQIQSLSAGSPVLVIEGNTTSSYKGGNLKLELDARTHLVDGQGNLIATRFAVPLLTAGEHLSANYPNPVKGSTMINYTLPEDGFVNISLYNQQGQLVKVITNGEAVAGNHQVTVNTDGLNAGIYYYTLQTQGNNPLNETKRMIVTR